MGRTKTYKLSDKDIALYALYLLGGWQKRIHLEDIALKCFKIAPSKFSWVKFPQYPDLQPTRFALEAAKKRQNGALVRGESERMKSIKNVGGWMLTSDGLDWIESNKPRIESSLGKRKPIGDRSVADRKLKELLRSIAFRKFSKDGDNAEISNAEFAESLICTVNTGPKILNDRLEQLYSIAVQVGRNEVKNYVDFCRMKFAVLL